MATKPSIHKFMIALSDLDREYYDSLNLTVARHPSETLERMLVRVLAYCCNASDSLVFCKGLSDTDEPDVWAKDLNGGIALWIDVGEPAFDRIKKASRLARDVKVYAFNTKSSVWWSQQQQEFAGLRISVSRFPWAPLQQLAEVMQRTMDMSVTISGDTVYVAAESGEYEFALEVLQTVN
ncbi:MAG TPA: hypothetical protein DEG76_05960 [Pseudohongiella sp.]|nr:hypothetical protein [Pseudohongiella sp.]|tara:strand:- start:996 stop:1535 length:540 start_codon:yes stop_codon:yes gene_type:complete